MKNQTCLGMVLAGGLSSRMGQDKALLTREKTLSSQQSSMLDFSKELLTKAGINEIVISSDKHGLADQIAQMGPLGGIYSVIEKYRPKALLIMPVDMPLMTHHCLQQLKRCGELSNKACFFQDNYLPLYLPINAFVEQFFNTLCHQNNNLANISHSGKNKGLSMRALLNQTPSQSIPSKKPLSLFNTNTPEQWHYAQQQLTQSKLVKVK